MTAYNYLFVPCVALFVHPERMIDWLSDLPRNKFVPSVLTLQVAAMLGIATWSLLLLSFSARFGWWQGVVWMGAAVAFRAIRCGIVSVFGLDRD